MLADVLFDEVLSGALKIVASSWRVAAELAKAVCRAADVGRKSPGKKHTAVEYVDTFLFPDDDHHSPR